MWDGKENEMLIRSIKGERISKQKIKNDFKEKTNFNWKYYWLRKLHEYKYRNMEISSVFCNAKDILQN